MITGLHTVIFTADADADRTFFRDVLKFPAVDAGGGWLIFAMPPAELAFHPTLPDEGNDQAGGDQGKRHEAYLMCDDVHAAVETLREAGAEINGSIEDAGWGLLTSFTTPGGSVFGIYQPKHPTALGQSG